MPEKRSGKVIKAANKRMDHVIVVAAKQMLRAIEKDWPTIKEDMEAMSGQSKFLMKPFRRRRKKK